MSERRSGAKAPFGGAYDVLDRPGHEGPYELVTARDVDSGEIVTIRVLAAHAPTDVVERFRCEVAAWARLKHPAIIHLREVGEDDGRPYAITDFVGDATLRQLMQRQRLDPGRVLDILARVADALAAAHDAGVVHRDVRPDIVFVGKQDQVRVGGWGLAGDVDRPGGLTATGFVVGTPAYLAPERVTGAAADARSDLYALGVMAFEALTGAPPFAGHDGATMLGERVRRPAPRLTGGPPEAADLVAELLERDPARRPTTARLVGMRLRKAATAIKGGGGSTEVSVPVARDRSEVRSVDGRRRMAAGLSIGVSVAVITAVFWARHAVVEAPPAVAPLVPPATEDAAATARAAEAVEVRRVVEALRELVDRRVPAAQSAASMDVLFDEYFALVDRVRRWPAKPAAERLSAATAEALTAFVVDAGLRASALAGVEVKGPPGGSAMLFRDMNRLADLYIRKCPPRQAERLLTRVIESAADGRSDGCPELRYIASLIQVVTLQRQNVQAAEKRFRSMAASYRDEAEQGPGEARDFVVMNEFAAMYALHAANVLSDAPEVTRAIKAAIDRVRLWEPPPTSSPVLTRGQRFAIYTQLIHALRLQLFDTFAMLSLAIGMDPSKRSPYLVELERTADVMMADYDAPCFVNDVHEPLLLLLSTRDQAAAAALRRKHGAVIAAAAVGR